MKKIGLLGGTSWTSTFLYYNLLNELYNKHHGDYNSAPIILCSINYNKIKKQYGNPDGWNNIPSLLKDELMALISMPIEAFIICNNTLHKAYDLLLDRHEVNFNVPIIHALELSAQQAKDKKYKSVLLLGTKFTMTDKFFKEYFYNKNINVVIPNEEEVDAIQAMQTRLAMNKREEYDSIFLEGILKKYRSTTDAAVLGCTELPLVIRNAADFCLINPIELQCKKAIELMIS